MIIALTGYKGSGKSTAAKFINEEFGFERVNFKDALIREMKVDLKDTLEALSQCHSMTLEQLFETKPLVMRQLMQNYGTEIVRNKLGKDYWVNQYSKTLANMEGKNIVTDDVRFQNEYDAVKLLGGIIVRVVQDGISGGGSHQSESEQDSFEADFTIVAQKGSHESIYNQIRQIIDTIKAD
jgi:Fe-S cluster assembly ATPase SufC